MRPDYKAVLFIAGSWRDNANKERLESLTSEIAGRGFQVVVIVDGQRTDLVRDDGNPIFYTWPSPRPTQMRDLFFLTRLIKQYSPYCLAAQFGSVNLMMLAGLLNGVPLRIAYHRTLSNQVVVDGKLPNWKIKLLIQRKALLFKCASHLIANSKAGLIDLNQNFHVPNHKLKIFHNSIKDPLSNNPELRSISRIPNRIICVGELRPRKGQDILIQAAQFLRDLPGLVIEFIGGGPMKSEYEKLAKYYEVENICTFTGGIPHDAVYEKMASAMVSVVPSRDEAFGYVNIESMAVGTPVVASNVGGIPEIIRDGIDGYLVPVGNQDALAERLRLLLSNPDVHQKMSNNARERYLDSFEITNSIKKEAQWFQELLH